MIQQNSIIHQQLPNKKLIENHHLRCNMGKISLNDSSDAAQKQNLHYINVNKIVQIPFIMGKDNLAK